MILRRTMSTAVSVLAVCKLIIYSVDAFFKTIIKEKRSTLKLF